MKSGRGPEPVLLVLGGTASPDDIYGLCERVSAALDSCDSDVVICDVAGIEFPDLSTIGALARAQLGARRSGGEIRLRQPPQALKDLLGLVAMTDVLPEETL